MSDSKYSVARLRVNTLDNRRYKLAVMALEFG